MEIKRMFITGDIHGDIQRLIYFIQRMELGENDGITVLGDAGLFWRKDKKDLEANIFNWEHTCNGVHLFFLDGNHENFKLLNQISIDENNMGIVSNHIHYLRRGYIYNFIGKKILVCGGADSIDKMRRIEGLTWWKEEAITQEDIDRVPADHYDYVFTHCCPKTVFMDNIVYLVTLAGLDQSKVDHTSEEMLDKLKDKITFNKWYFGHYHTDKELEGNFRCVLNDYIEI